MTSLAHRFLHSQRALSERFDRLLPADYKVDGNRDFVENWIAQHLKPGMSVYDIGGGKNPILSLREKQRLGLRLTGLDIDAEELAASPPAIYDKKICADIMEFQGDGDADLVICQALLEHVRDSRAAIRAIASILKPGATALIFLPSRNAVFARMNLLLPQALKRKILYTVFPFTRRNQGFRAYYDHCTLGDFQRIAAGSGLAVDVGKAYFSSGYFTFFFPLYFVWRLWVLLFRFFAREQAAETFSMALRKI
jgi:2-polyprenyl-6-hydroxyphenyl methylase/3-demethylubiquinone-9 3-methyltransferase